MASTQEMMKRAKAKRDAAKPVKDTCFRITASEVGKLTRMITVLESGVRNAIATVHPIIAEAERTSPLRCPRVPSSNAVLLKPGTGPELNCVTNVQAAIAADPSLTWQLGFNTHQDPKTGYTACEAHCVVRHPDGHLEDVTAVFGPDKVIHFTPMTVLSAEEIQQRYNPA